MTASRVLFCAQFILGIIFLAASFPYISSVLVAIAQAAQYATDGAYQLPHGRHRGGPDHDRLRLRRRRQVRRHGRHGPGPAVYPDALVIVIACSSWALAAR